MNLEGFDPSKHEDNNDFTPIPAGEYKAWVSRSEKKDTKDGTGHYLLLVWEILGPTHKGRLIFDRLHLKNRSDKAVEIARRNLASVCRATGVMAPKDSSQFHEKPIKIKVKVKPASGDFGASNEVSGYIGGEKTKAAEATRAIGAETPPPPSDDDAPWE